MEEESTYYETAKLKASTNMEKMSSIPGFDSS